MLAKGVGVAEVEREPLEYEDMVRVSVRVPTSLRDALYQVGQERMIKPTQYAAVCLAMGHSILSRMLDPMMYMQTEAIQQVIEEGSEPTAEEKRTYEALLAKK
jgi:hypothetical protein